MRFLILILSLLPFTLPAQTVMSLSQAVNYAQEHNRQIQLAKLKVEDASAQIVERRAFGIPTLNANVGYNRFLELPVTILPEEFGIDPATGQVNPNFNREVRFGLKNNLTGSLNLRTIVLDPSYIVGLQAARAYRDYTAQELVSAQREMRYRVTEAFLPVLLVNENAANLDSNITVLETLYRETKAMQEAGFVELLDVERLELSVLTLKTERENLLAQKRNILNGLKMAIGFPMEQDLDVSGTLSELMREAGDAELAGKVAYESWPDYRVARQGLNLAQLNVRLNKFAYLPTLDAFANYQRIFNGDTFDGGFWASSSVAGLGLKIPIFDGLLTQARIQRSIVTRRETEVQVGLLEQQIEMTVRNARNQYSTAVQRLRDQERHLALAARIWATTRTKYREGVGSSLEMNQAEQAMFAAQRQLIQARHDVIQTLFQLEKALGK